MPHSFAHLTNKYTNHTAKLFVSSMTVGGFNPGNPLAVEMLGVRDFQRELKSCDVLHIHGTHALRQYKIKGVPLDHHLKNKKVILHYHGSPQRENPNAFRYNWPKIVSTPEMLPLFEDAKFFPNLIDGDHSLYRERQYPHGPFFHFPHPFSLHPTKKDTTFLKDVSAKMQAEHYWRKIVFLPNMRLQDSLNERNEYYSIIDHFQGYYGVVSIEGMAQGKMVINGCNEYCLGKLKEFFGETPPFYVVQKEKLFSELSSLTRRAQSENGYYCKKFFNEYWNGKLQIHRLIEIYERL